MHPPSPDHPPGMLILPSPVPKAPDLPDLPPTLLALPKFMRGRPADEAAGGMRRPSSLSGSIMAATVERARPAGAQARMMRQELRACTCVLTSCARVHTYYMYVHAWVCRHVTLCVRVYAYARTSVQMCVFARAYVRGQYVHRSPDASGLECHPSVDRQVLTACSPARLSL